jgi:hypothetical protein
VAVSASVPTASVDKAQLSIDDLISLLIDHREALLEHGSVAADEIDAYTRALEQALAQLGAPINAPNHRAAGTPSNAGTSPLRASRIEWERLQDEIRATQATLSKVAAGNQRALDVLFGEASSYASRQGARSRS